MKRYEFLYKPNIIFSIDTISLFTLKDFLPKNCANEEMVNIFARAAESNYGYDAKAPYDADELIINLYSDKAAANSPTSKVYEFVHPAIKLRKGRLSALDLPEHTEFKSVAGFYRAFIKHMPARPFADYVRLLYRYSRNIGHTRYSTNFEFFTWCNDCLFKPELVAFLLDISKHAAEQLLELDKHYRQHKSQAKAFEELQTIQTKTMYRNAQEFERALELNRPTLTSPNYFTSSPSSSSSSYNSANTSYSSSLASNQLQPVTAESIERQFKEFLKKATNDVYKDIEMHSLAIVKRFLTVYNNYKPGYDTKEDVRVANVLSQCLRTIHSIKLANQKSDERIAQLEEELSALKTKALNQSQSDVTVKFVTKSNTKEEPTK